MKTRLSTLIVVGLLSGLFSTAALPALGANAPAPANPEPRTDSSMTPSKADGRCDDCGIIEAIVQRPIAIGANGYFVYDFHVRMDKTKLLRTITMPTQASLDKGQHVHTSAGNLVPVN